MDFGLWRRVLFSHHHDGRDGEGLSSRSILLLSGSGGLHNPGGRRRIPANPTSAVRRQNYDILERKRVNSSMISRCEFFNSVNSD